MGEIHCPKCGAALRPDDINIKEGVALCRACSTLTRLAPLAEDPVLAKVDPAIPPAGCTFSSNGAETTVCASSRSVAGAVGTLAIACFWNGIVSVFVSVALASTMYHIIGHVPAWFPAPQAGAGGKGNLNSAMPVGVTIFLWFFLLPFITIGLGLLIAVFLSLAGRVEVRIRNNQGAVFVGCGPVGYRRSFDPAKVTSVSIGQTTWKENDQSKPLIVLQSDKPIRFGSGLPDARRLWLTAVLKELLVP